MVEWHFMLKGILKVQLTLGYHGHLYLWRILHVKLLVGERSGLLKLTERQRFSTGDDLEHKMTATENPFAILYSCLA
jgi:mediator of RNA polymerase II transcription subunit 14